jgi:hypothetical protein
VIFATGSLNARANGGLEIVLYVLIFIAGTVTEIMKPAYRSN